MTYFRFLAALGLILVCALPASAADQTEPHLSLKNHAFAPQQLTVPAGQKIKLTVRNEDATAAEFESDELGREKIVPANGEVSFFIGPLDPGTYPFFDDFHHAATGTIVAK